MTLKNRTVLITGGGGGLGRAMAEAFAREGARIVLHDVVPSAREVADRLGGAFLLADLSDQAAVRQLAADALAAAGGRIDILINNAAIGVTAEPLEKIRADEWDAGFRGNVRQMVACAKAVLPEMVKQGGGAIVNTCTIYGVTGGTSSLLYGPVKAGAIQLTRHIALYYGKDRIRANCVCPGHIVTPRTREIYERDWSLPQKYPIGRLGKMDDIVEAYLFLTSEESSFMTGAVVLVDGGYTIT